jgi:hypothetical protein
MRMGLVMGVLAAVMVAAGPAAADMRDMCEDAAHDRGWRVRDTESPKKFGERRMDMQMRVRDGGKSFDAVCTAEDDKVSVHRRD